MQFECWFECSFLDFTCLITGFSKSVLHFWSPPHHPWMIFYLKNIIWTYAHIRVTLNPCTSSLLTAYVEYLQWPWITMICQVYAVCSWTCDVMANCTRLPAQSWMYMGTCKLLANPLLLYLSKPPFASVKKWHTKNYFLFHSFLKKVENLSC